MSDFSQQLAHLLRARFPVIAVPTWEEERALAEIQAIGENTALIRTPRQVFTWRITAGLHSVDGTQNPKSAQGSSINAIEMLDFIVSYTQPAIFVLQDFHIYFPLGTPRSSDENFVIRRLRDVIPHVRQSANLINIVLLSPEITIPTELQKDVAVLEFPLPTASELQRLISDFIAAQRQNARIVIDLTLDEIDGFAQAALGLTTQEMENALARAVVQDGRLDISDLAVIVEEKRQVIKRSAVLEFIPKSLSIDDVGGLGNLKRWLRKRNGAWLSAARRYGISSPKGLLITGIPGCGKSLFAKAISDVWQLPLLRLDIGRIFGMYIGQSEQNIRTVIATAEAISPCILWIDEIEKGFGNTSEGSGDGSLTASRVFGTFLTWMQEKSKPVFVVATSNLVEALPPELLRKGRFDEIFFVDLPTTRERVSILRVHIERRITDPIVIGSFVMDDGVLLSLAQATEGFVGAEIEHVVESALFEAFAEQRTICVADFQKAIKNTVPLAVTQSEQILSIRRWASTRAVAATAPEDRVEYSKHADGDKDADIRSSRGGRTVDF